MSTTTISKVYPHVFIGNKNAIITREEILQKNNIQIVISALTEEEYEDYMIGEQDFENVDWHRLVIDDDQNEDIQLHFSTITNIIGSAINNGMNVLVHCAAGVSRSATLVLAYIMTENNMKFDDALAHVQKYRPEVEPNAGFQRRLYELEDYIFGTNQPTESTQSV
jgi:protein-tyrosine phosphatase